jgi:hypothetical protein
MGNLTIDTPGEYFFTSNVPVNAWKEYGKLTQTTGDTAASNEYPADIGYQKTAATMNFGPSQTFYVPGPNESGYSTPGIRGFVYVKGNLTYGNFMDFVGAVWVNGNVSPSATAPSNGFCSIFYQDDIQLPTLNVVLVRQNWQEVPPSTSSWN